MNILFATSELYPFVKTGGLADVSSSLTAALSKSGNNVTIILPGYRTIIEQLSDPVTVYEVSGADLPAEVAVHEYYLDTTNVRLMLVFCPDLFERDGGIYVDQVGRDWEDNANRFTQFSKVVVGLLDSKTTNSPYYFDVVHCNDWQCGLIPAFIAEQKIPVKTVFTIHNLAYQGVFDRGTFNVLSLPGAWWHYEKLEFYGNFSFLKAGIVFADQVTTVSPTYAQEILFEPQACGMSGLLQHYQFKLSGILNGVDYSVWNPDTDPHLCCHFDAESIDNKAKNKVFLQKKLGLRPLKSALLVGVICRFAHQKGIDSIISAIEALKNERIQWAILGAGEDYYQEQLIELASRLPAFVSVTVAYDEELAHQIEAGSDVFAMPSRYEPCGLNQLYSMAYGTLPIVRKTGGLADTVVSIDDESIKNQVATGFVFDRDTKEAFIDVICRAQGLYRKRKIWKGLRLTAMNQCFDWKQSAESYLQLYKYESEPV